MFENLLPYLLTRDKLPTHVDDYPLVYTTDSGRVLCGPCADHVLHDDTAYDKVDGAGVYYEGHAIECDGREVDDCSRFIQSAYGPLDLLYIDED